MTLPASEKSDLYERFALTITYGINPFVLPPVVFVVVLHHLGAEVGERALIGLISFVFFSVLPLAYIAHRVHQGKADSLEIRTRTQRTRPFLVAIAAYVVGLLFMASVGTTAVPILAALGALMAFNAVLVTIVNRFWKISVHASSVAGVASVLSFVLLQWPGTGTVSYAPMVVIWSLFLLGPVMWSRVRLRAHTVNQVFGGSVFGLVLPFVEMLLLVKLGVIN